MIENFSDKELIEIYLNENQHTESMMCLCCGFKQGHDLECFYKNKEKNLKVSLIGQSLRKIETNG